MLKANQGAARAMLVALALFIAGSAYAQQADEPSAAPVEAQTQAMPDAEEAAPDAAPVEEAPVPEAAAPESTSPFEDLPKPYFKHPFFWLLVLIIAVAFVWVVARRKAKSK